MELCFSCLGILIYFSPNLVLCIPLIFLSNVSFWQGVIDGTYDDLSEQSFYMVGGIEDVIAKAEKIAKESAA